MKAKENFFLCVGEDVPPCKDNLARYILAV